MATQHAGSQTPRHTITLEGAAEHVRVLLSRWLGETTSRPGLVDTPQRYCKALKEMTAGYGMDPKEILAAVFPETYDEMVVLGGIRFTSLCEHHLMPFMGTATIGYLPNGQVVGISKLARLTECFARRLQIQERMTAQIADAVNVHLQPKGVGVIVEARHECMACRGVKQSETVMITSALRGVFLSGRSREEFMTYWRKTHA